MSARRELTVRYITSHTGYMVNGHTGYMVHGHTGYMVHGHTGYMVPLIQSEVYMYLE